MLTDEQKAIVKMRWEQGWKISYIARALGLTREYVQDYVRGLVVQGFQWEGLYRD